MELTCTRYCRHQHSVTSIQFCETKKVKGGFTPFFSLSLGSDDEKREDTEIQTGVSDDRREMIHFPSKEIASSQATARNN